MPTLRQLVDGTCFEGSFFAGGEGSGCNPGVGQCGRRPKVLKGVPSSGYSEQDQRSGTRTWKHQNGSEVEYIEKSGLIQPRPRINVYSGSGARLMSKVFESASTHYGSPSEESKAGAKGFLKTHFGIDL